jgi:SAM-dependent methyltransferase
MRSLAECMPPDTTMKPAHYLVRYEKRFSPIRDHVRALLELGIHEGGSLLMWREYFPNATVAGLDLKAAPYSGPEERVRTYQGAQDDFALLDRIARECAPDGFDVIIDDCSHNGAITKRSFWHLFDKHLKPGGIFVIEDWGAGYWDKWPDGRYVEVEPDRTRRFSEGERVEFPSHLIGLPGFVKQLVDESAAPDITLEGYTRTRWRRVHAPVDSLEISLGQVFVVKGN